MDVHSRNARPLMTLASAAHRQEPSAWLHLPCCYMAPEYLCTRLRLWVQPQLKNPMHGPTPHPPLLACCRTCDPAGSATAPRTPAAPSRRHPPRVSRCASPTTQVAPPTEHARMHGRRAARRLALRLSWQSHSQALESQLGVELELSVTQKRSSARRSSS